MALELTTLGTLANEIGALGALNANFNKIEKAINNSVLHRNADLGMAGGNAMSRPLDMDGNELTNVNLNVNCRMMGYKVPDLVQWSSGAKDWSLAAGEYCYSAYEFCSDAYTYKQDTATLKADTQAIRDSLQPQYTALASTVGTNTDNISALNTTVAGKAAKGANSDITSLNGLTTPLSVAQGGIGVTNLPALLTALGVSSSTGAFKIGPVQAYFGTATVTTGVVTITPPAAITVTAAFAVPVTASAVAAQYFSYDSSSTTTSVKFRSSNASGTGSVMYLILGIAA